MKEVKVNPLNVLGLRQVKFPAVHFHYTSQSTNASSKINDWIYHNLKGRYYLGPGVALNNNSIEYVLKIGFEIEKELSFFKLACPYISYR